MTPSTHSRIVNALNAITLLTFMSVSTGCATFLKSSPYPVYVTGSTPPRGVVLSHGFSHSNFAHVNGYKQISYDESTWLNNKMMSFFIVDPPSSKQARTVLVHCNCILKDSGQIYGNKQIAPTIDCLNKKFKKGVSYTINTKMSGLWVFANLITTGGLGIIVDVVTGALFDYDTLDISAVCRHQKRAQSR